MQAVWSRRIALFAAQLMVLGVILHQLGAVTTPVVNNLLSIAVAIALAGLLFAGLALVMIWRQGMTGAGRALGGAFVALGVLAVPLWYLPDLLLRPKINDVATDLSTPPAFLAAAADRPGDANPLTYPGAQFAELQAQAYPDVRPMTLEKSRIEAYDLVREAVERLDWRILSARKPTETTPGHIEAVAKTLIMGFADDVVIRITAVNQDARIDMRSASRYGEHDFGANARRIRRLFTEVKIGLEEGEKRALEMALARRNKELKEKARRELERKQRLEQQARRLSRRRARSSAEDARIRRAPRQPAGQIRDPGRFFQQFRE